MPAWKAPSVPVDSTPANSVCTFLIFRGFTLQTQESMRRSLLLRASATLALITCVGHTVGIFLPIPAEQVEMHATIAVMKTTMIPMPVGQPRSYLQILDGNNFCTSLLLLLLAAQLFAISGAPGGESSNKVVLISALALGALAAISARYFFPVPTLLTALAAALSILALTRRTS
jgi:hypothetical protein